MRYKIIDTFYNPTKDMGIIDEKQLRERVDDLIQIIVDAYDDVVIPTFNSDIDMINFLQDYGKYEVIKVCDI